MQLFSYLNWQGTGWLHPQPCHPSQGGVTNSDLDQVFSISNFLLLHRNSISVLSRLTYLDHQLDIQRIKMYLMYWMCCCIFVLIYYHNWSKLWSFEFQPLTNWRDPASVLCFQKDIWRNLCSPADLDVVHLSMARSNFCHEILIVLHFIDTHMTLRMQHTEKNIHVYLSNVNLLVRRRW